MATRWAHSLWMLIMTQWAWVWRRAHTLARGQALPDRCGDGLTPTAIASQSSDYMLSMYRGRLIHGKKSSRVGKVDAGVGYSCYHVALFFAASSQRFTVRHEKEKGKWHVHRATHLLGWQAVVRAKLFIRSTCCCIPLLHPIFIRYGSTCHLAGKSVRLVVDVAIRVKARWPPRLPFMFFWFRL